MCWLTTHGFFQKEGEKQWNEMCVCYNWLGLLVIPAECPSM